MAQVLIHSINITRPNTYRPTKYITHMNNLLLIYKVGTYAKSFLIDPTTVKFCDWCVTLEICNKRKEK